MVCDHFTFLFWIATWNTNYTVNSDLNEIINSHSHGSEVMKIMRKVKRVRRMKKETTNYGENRIKQMI